MIANKKRRHGGLVLETSELRSIIYEPGTMGLAFALNRRRRIQSVDLDIFRVYCQDGTLRTEQCNVTSKAGAGGAWEYPSSSISDFSWALLDSLRDSKFVFAYLPRSEFSRLLEYNHQEVFLSLAVQQSWHDRLIGNNPYFTLSISRRRKIHSEILIETSKTKGAEPRGIMTMSANGNKMISAHDLFDSVGIINTATPTVENILLDSRNSSIRGMKIRGKDDILSSVLFEPNSEVESIITDENRILKVIMKKGKEGKGEDKESLAGSVTPTLYLVSCPPYWPDGDNGLTFEEQVKQVIFKTIGH